MVDYCTEEGAKRLASKIEAYWAERGSVVKTHIEVTRGGHNMKPSIASGRTW